LTLCFIALLALVSLIPARFEPGGYALTRLVAETPPLLQKLLHVLLYALLVLLLSWSLEIIRSRSYRFLIAVFLAVLFGALMEWCQSWVPGRFGTLLDVALNAAGAGLGLLMAIVLL
jgi:VanZ family protein